MQHEVVAAREHLLQCALRLVTSTMYVESNPEDAHGSDEVDLQVDNLDAAVRRYNAALEDVA